ncbi:MAG TPA: nucleotidyltransferase family protein [Candidatus Acidoferrales bacterium]|nr:nucleotidyltransferase family protein [Candidatus Acidoferrales bacterium]
MRSSRREHSYPPRKRKSSEVPQRSPRHAKAARNSPIVPIILAAGDRSGQVLPKPLARFGERTALEIALENCTGLARPIVVLGHQAKRVRPVIPPSVRVVVHPGWRSGQLSSLRAGLRRVPEDSPFLLYPVDYPLLTPSVIRRLVNAFGRRSAQHKIVVPTFHGRGGHPVIFSPAVRGELTRARTAREVVRKDDGRVKFVPVETAAIEKDFDTPASYRWCWRAYLRQRR